MNKLTSTKNIYYPPGGILIWIIIFLELITFGFALIAMAYYSQLEPDIFHDSKNQLNLGYGTLNTLILLTSGFFMAQSVQYFKIKNFNKSSHYIKITTVLGLLFLIIKGIEYYAKIEQGLGMTYNTFFTFYWMLTLFHVIHVMVGMIILIFINRDIYKNKNEACLDDLEAGAAFWHMCDLIWLILFPFIYLIF